MTNSNIKITESEHPAAMHQQDINACVHHIRDAVVDYLESDILTPGEFVSAIKTALGDSSVSYTHLTLQTKRIV